MSGQQIRIKKPDGSILSVTVSKEDSRILAYIAKLSKILEKRIDDRYSELHENNSVYGQITSGQFRIDANDIMDIFDDVVEEMAIEMDAEYSLLNDSLCHIVRKEPAGYSSDFPRTMFWLSCGHKVVVEGLEGDGFCTYPKYCPKCGREVVIE